MYVCVGACVYNDMCVNACTMRMHACFFHRTCMFQDGKVAGWHDYDASASDIVEDVYEQWQSDATLNVRCVQVCSYRMERLA